MVEFVYRVEQAALVFTGLFLVAVIFRQWHDVGSTHISRGTTLAGSLMAAGMLVVGFWPRLLDSSVFYMNWARDTSTAAQFSGSVAFFLAFLIGWWFHGVLRGVGNSGYREWETEHRLMALTLSGSVVLTILDTVR